MTSRTESSSGPSEDVGARLRAAREAKQISLREIAATTKISVSALEALEQNDIAGLPGGIFTRAFVRSYASEVGLDPEQTMRDFVAQVPADGGSEAAQRDPIGSHDHDLFQSQQRMAGTVLKLAGFGVPLAVLLLFLGTRDARVPPPDAPDDVVPTEAPTSPPARLDPPPPPEPAVAQSLALVLRPRGECWVSLTVDGELVFARVMRAGEQESYEADDEIILNLGDAGAFDFTINEQDGRSLGGAGEVVTARITHQNYRSYLVP